MKKNKENGLSLYARWGRSEEVGGFPALHLLLNC